MADDTSPRPRKWCPKCEAETERGARMLCLPCGRARRAANRGRPRYLRWCESCSAETEWYGWGRCAPCHRASASEYGRKNAASLSEYQARWRAENAERLREYERGRMHDPRRVAAQREWHRLHPESKAATERRARERDPDSWLARARAAANRRRARKADALVHDVPEAMVWEFNPSGPGCCNYCAKPLAFDDRASWHIDHVVPLARGGMHEIGNLVIACARCNLSKGAKLLSEWTSRAS